MEEGSDGGKVNGGEAVLEKKGLFEVQTSVGTEICGDKRSTNLHMKLEEGSLKFEQSYFTVNT